MAATAVATTEEKTDKVRMADLAERMLWTFVAGFTSALISPELAQAAGLHMSITVLDSAVLAGVGAVMSYVSVIARWRLEVLPNPGSGLRR